MSANLEDENYESPRVKAIKAMYQYKATEEEHLAVPDDSLEVIYNWYIDGFPTIEPLEKLFDIEDLYDMDEIELKIFPRDKITEMV